MQKAKFLLCWAVCLLLLVPCLGQTKTSATSPPSARSVEKQKRAATAVARTAADNMKVAFTDLKLKNGLRVILSEDHTAPLYSICVTYNVGSRDERPGRTGFAHLFEHMMFQGSENIGKGEHMLLVENNGGGMNGTTNEDRTVYFETLPANQLDLGLFLESDRMRALAVNEANLENQRKTVQEERRLGVDNRAYGKLTDTLPELVYDGFPYKHSVIGSMADLDAATVQDVKDFFRIYYAPNNAVLSLVGDFKVADALARIKQYFESIPAQPAPQPPDMTEPQQAAERRKTIEDSFAPTPLITIVYKIPRAETPDHYAAVIAARPLCGSASSRLYQSVVKEKELATSLTCYADGRRGTSLFTISVNARPGKDLAEVEKSVYEEIEKFKAAPITDAELTRIRMSIRRSQAAGLQTSLSRATQLGQYAVFFDNPNLINVGWEKWNAVTKADVQRVAKAYLTAANRTVIITLPKPKTASTAAPAQPGL